MILHTVNGNTVEYAAIGLIRLKRVGEHYEAILYPPAGEVTFPDCNAMMAEVTIPAEEAERIRSVAPHLVAQPVWRMREEP